MLFLCVHNAGRSQMAAGWLRHLAGDRVTVYSGGSEPASEINPAAVEAMAEVGIDITDEFPKPWTDEIVRAADVVITMGCGDACPLYPGKRYEDWELDDPAGQDVAAVRPIRDEIRRPGRGPDGDPARRRLSRPAIRPASAERSDSSALGTHPVPGPPAPLLPFEEPGLDQQREVVGHRRLGPAERRRPGRRRTPRRSRRTRPATAAAAGPDRRAP